MSVPKDDGCRAYERREFSEERANIVIKIRKLVEYYGGQGMNVTVRQIYYQFVARGWAPSGDKSYDRIQSALNDGRMAGLIPWTMVEDRGRELRTLASWSDPQSGLRDLRTQYRRDLWELQTYRPEVWVEKQALEGVIGDICCADDMRVDYYATKGYDSQSQQWRAGRRIAHYIRQGYQPIIFYLGDHDPSGLDMTRDVQERLSLFTGVPVIVQRLGLTMHQIKKFNPPSFPVKAKDSRSKDYIEQYGHEAWELDALDPSVLRGLIRDAVTLVKDPDAWSRSLEEEVEDLRTLDVIVEKAHEGIFVDPDEE